MCKMTHVINVEIKDNHDDATLGAFLIHELVKEVGSFISIFYKVETFF